MNLDSAIGAPCFWGEEPAATWPREILNVLLVWLQASLPAMQDTAFQLEGLCGSCRAHISHSQTCLTVKCIVVVRANGGSI